jgi:hypothetical protein
MAEEVAFLPPAPRAPGEKSGYILEKKVLVKSPFEEVTGLAVTVYSCYPR